VDELQRRRQEFLEKIFAGKRVKSKVSVADVQGDGPWSDPMREKDFYDGLPIPYGDELLVNPFC